MIKPKFIFIRLKNLSGSISRHRWEYNGKVMAEQPFDVAPSAGGYGQADARSQLTGNEGVRVDSSGATFGADADLLEAQRQQLRSNVLRNGALKWIVAEPSPESPGGGFYFLRRNSAIAANQNFNIHVRTSDHGSV